jgi:hypothetical protein
MRNKKGDSHRMRSEYEFDYSKAVRGKYCGRLLRERSDVVLLDPDVAKVFRNSTSVNKALRSLLELTRSTSRLTRQPRKRRAS